MKRLPAWLFIPTALFLVLGGAHQAQAQNYYWKDYNNNGQWDWGNNQWYGSSQGNTVGAPQSDGGAIIWFENTGNQTTTINSGTGFSGGWFKLNSVYAAANSTSRNYIVNVKSGETGIELYNKIETISGGGTLSFANIDVQLGANAQINAVGNTLTLGGLRMNGKTLDSYGASSLNIQGAIIGTGAYNIKNQGTTVTYSGNSANTFSGTTTVENSSQLLLNKSANTAAIAGQLVINSGGTVRTDAAGQLNNQLVTVNGTLNLNNQNQSLALAGTSSGSVTLGSGTITINNSGSDSFAGIISGTGGLTKVGTGTLTLGNAQKYTGITTVSGGKISISGATLDSSEIRVSGGIFETSAADIVANTSAVNLSSGTYALGGDDTVASLTVSGGLLSTANGSTLTAATYALNGGEVSANLGAGTVNTSSGTTLLSGTSGAANVNVSGGLLSLVSADRLNNTAAVAVSSGELAVGANDTVGSLSTTDGTVSGAGTLTAATYALNGGTVSANLGAGTVNTSSGTTLLSGTSSATAVTVSGGVLNTSGADKLADGAAVAVSSGTLGVGGSDTVGSLAASGTGVVTVATGTTLTANGNSSITGSARATGGTVAVANNSLLNLANSSTTTTSDLSIGSGSTLAGTGGTSGQIKGSGLLSPGNSPGILTSGSVDLSGGIDFAFEFTAAGAPTYSQATNSKNDLLHLTSGSTPFSGSFSMGNTVSLYFNDAGLSASLLSGTPTTYLGGFFVDSSSYDIAGLLSTANMQYFIAASGGTTSFNGVNYNLMSNEVASRMILSNVNQSAADFTTGTVNGTVLGVTAVPEPSSGSLLLAGIGSLLILRRFRRKA